MHLAPIAKQIHSVIAALDYDLMVALKLLDLNDDSQERRTKILVKKPVLLPGQKGRPLRRRLKWSGVQRVAALVGMATCIDRNLLA